MAAAHKRKRAYRYGHFAEAIAAWYLRAKGYRIIAMRYRNHYGEIDLLAHKKNTLIAVEVKARQSLKACEESVPPWKQQKIARAMEGVLSGQSGGRGKIAGLVAAKSLNIRFDVIWIAPWQWPRHITDAWRM